MDKDQRNALRKAVEAARSLLEREVGEQLEGTYNILPDGRVLANAPGDPVLRARLLDVVEHHRAGGASPQEAVERTRREIAFTNLNRFAALKMAERRGLVRECVSQGLASEGLQELAGCAPGLRAACADGGYRLLLETVMDEVSVGLRVLFDRRSPTGLIWPRPRALDALLAVLNAPELEALWSEDETIGWVYQYFNSQDERRAMRDASAAPRSSRELAVRNQFFTPRYVVEFLTENTLGRLWHEMREGETALKERCRLLVRRPDEVFLGPGQQPPARGTAREGDGGAGVDRPFVLPRPRKDPRDLRVLDPACGSGHFLLYAFDLLQTVYREGWADPQAPVSEQTGQTLRADHPTEDALRRAMPALILEHNLWGIEIDPRAAQIAALALWLRAQRAYAEMGLDPVDRPPIRRAHIVVAEPMPGERPLLDGFLASLEPAPLRDVVRRVFDEMRLAGEAGSLLKMEREVQSALERARDAWREGAQLPLLAEGPGAGLGVHGGASADVDERFWQAAEGRIYEALARYAAGAVNGEGYRRGLFAHDAAQGFAFLDVCRQQFDVVLMNPPFGEPSQRSKTYITKTYPRTKNDLYAAFVERGLEWLHPRGMLGAITSRTGFFLTSFQRWREEILLKEARPTVVADLGYGVMDAAMVEAAAYVLEKGIAP